ncbi:MAG: YjgP/YjgQ family permease [Lentisphaerae bacterium]|nr:YjgP/YjgQ family permease [Lentisphaerota bacterium]
MRILNRYVIKSFLVAFGMAILILTFAMTGANLIRVLDFISRGIPMSVFGTYILYMLPRILTFTIPWAVMVAVMLVFGRMSADSELTAMRACGISILQIVSPLLLIAVMLTGLCIYLQVEIGPPLLGKSRSMLKQAGLERPLAMFEPGSPLTLNSGDSSIVINIDSKTGDNELQGIFLCKARASDDFIEQTITAEKGTITADTKTQMLHIVLKDCMTSNRSSGESGSEVVEQIFSNELIFKFDYGKEANAGKVSVRAKYMKFTDLLGEIRRFKQNNIPTLEMEIELNKRIAFALSPIAFLLLGMPLAIRTGRRETSIGLFVSVVLAGVFFMSVIMCQNLNKFPQLYPQYLLWLPNIIFQILGAVMTWRISQR